jgi:hypothetical protein
MLSFTDYLFRILRIKNMEKLDNGYNRFIICSTYAKGTYEIPLMTSVYDLSLPYRQKKKILLLGILFVIDNTLLNCPCSSLIAHI